MFSQIGNEWHLVKQSLEETAHPTFAEREIKLDHVNYERITKSVRDVDTEDQRHGVQKGKCVRHIGRLQESKQMKINL